MQVFNPSTLNCAVYEYFKQLNQFFFFTDKIAEALDIMTSERPDPASGWVRPLGDAERLFARGGTLGSFNTVQAVWLDCLQKIHKEHILKAMKLWYR